MRCITFKYQKSIVFRHADKKCNICWWCALIRDPIYFPSLASYPEKPEPIDWEFYRRNTTKPELVDSFKKQFEALSVPYPKDTTSGILEEQQKKIVSFSVLLAFQKYVQQFLINI